MTMCVYSTSTAAASHFHSVRKMARSMRSCHRTCCAHGAKGEGRRTWSASHPRRPDSHLIPAPQPPSSPLLRARLCGRMGSNPSCWSHYHLCARLCITSRTQ